MPARAVTAVYAATIFLSALLLFWVELMVGKMLLPIWGGAPAVWVTCMVFFQAALLAGYAWAHAGVTFLGARRQAGVHALLVALPLALLPLSVDGRAEWLHSLPPVAALLALLALSVGLPFFVLSTTSPLLQRWFAEARGATRADPYALYAASNLGSLLALIAYPAAIEPWLGLSRQARAWSAGYGSLALLLAACAVLLWLSRSASTSPATGAAPPDPPPPPMRRLRWIALAAIPSSHLLGVTSYLTTDIAPIPLLWVLPLAIYLLTFVLVFSPANPIPHAKAVRFLPFFATVSALLLFSEANRPLWLVVPAHLAAFFLGAMVCHGALASDRPSPARLTGYYLHLSAGGVLGGLFNAVAAPLLFDGLAEYPLALVAACLFRAVDGAPAFRRRDLAWTLGIGGATLALVLGWEALGRDPDRVSVFLLFCVPILLVYRNLRFPARYALSLGAMFLAASFYTGAHGRPLLAERSFFGALRVTKDREGLHRLVHGGTVHGRQHHGDPALSGEPIDYYARTGPVGQVYDIVRADRPRGSIGVVGLGVGEVAAYALPEQRWTFYEIDPLVARIATDEHLFTYLRDAFPDPARRTLEIGDARLLLERAPDAGFDLLVLDAFSSDAIPLHLVTRESLALYRRKLAPDGILAFHVSNNFVELEPVLGNLAADAGLTALARRELVVPPEELALGKQPSRWVAMSRDPARLAPLREKKWEDAPRQESLGVWTDDHSNLLRVLRLF